MKIEVRMADGPEGLDNTEYADYLRHVADQIEEGYTSGHVDRETGWDVVSPAAEAVRRDGTPRMTSAQRDRLWEMCANYSVPFRETDYHLAGKQASIGAGWVEGWVGGADGSGITSRKTIYVGVDPEGRSHT